MSNYGMDMGSGNKYNGKTTIKNKTTIKKGHVIISITVCILLLVAVTILFNLFNKKDITGRWIDEDGDYFEFLSDGTIHQNGDDGLYFDTYEITDEGYLKWGKYSAGLIDYKYKYWIISISGDKMTLTEKENPKYSMVLQRE